MAVQESASSRSAASGADITKARKWLPQPPGPMASSIARQIRPPWTTTGTGAQWYLPSARSRPERRSFGSVQVRPPSVERRITT